MSDSTLELDDTIVGRWEYNDTAGNHCIKGAIEEPIECPYAVYYNTRFKEQTDGFVFIDGVAGFDGFYEKAPFHWIWKVQEKVLIITDWRRSENVSAEVFKHYSDHVFYRRNDKIIRCDTTEEDVGYLPYYRYPRTKDGPIIPELASHVLGILPVIVFVE